MEIPLTQGLFATIDAIDAPLVTPYKWCAKWCYSKWYAYTNIKRRGTYMHKLLTGWVLTDHQDGNGLNNRRSNLRESTKAQNMFNSQKRRGATTSRFKGVDLHACGKWRARISKDGHDYNLGLFASEKAAVEARRSKEVELFGEFARL